MDGTSNLSPQSVERRVNVQIGWLGGGAGGRRRRRKKREQVGERAREREGWRDGKKEIEKGRDREWGGGRSAAWRTTSQRSTGTRKRCARVLARTRTRVRGTHSPGQLPTGQRVVCCSHPCISVRMIPAKGCINPPLYQG
jgi:hypothetical protein